VTALFAAHLSRSSGCKTLAVPNKDVEEKTRTALYCATTQRVEVIPYRRFCTISR